MLVVGNTPCPGSKGMGCGTFTAAEEETVMALWYVDTHKLAQNGQRSSVLASHADWAQ